MLFRFLSLRPGGRAGPASKVYQLDDTEVYLTFATATNTTRETLMLMEVAIATVEGILLDRYLLGEYNIQ